eukprot:gnl/MRDRNA2_/MRDRNA2_288605_c0_seq1.p1 gnl/MRDRNA2_/MRDRNA2_288605_c0~~gnl/MRDRNA2_/MRDRNA2_288605_c0_seq1.p1  ORF type:complete len:170 (-),score=24.81 gnl/MRDRNA2_/MRDRNA2_288605_c0_seq1:142-585(-)
MVDYFDFPGPWFAMSTIMGVSLLLYNFAVQHWISYCIVTPLIFSCQGGVFALAPTVAASAFGPVQGATVFAYLWSAFAAASFAGPPLTRKLSDLGGWYLVWGTFGAAAIFAGALAFALPPGALPFGKPIPLPPPPPPASGPSNSSAA